MAFDLHTIGYEGRSVEAMLSELTAAGVAVLVDVRELPLSRRRGFSKTRLGEACRGAGIEYRHVRALGNPKPYRDLYKSGRVDAGAAQYREHLHAVSADALADLAGDLDAGLCLLCVEGDHTACHRAVIVDSLARLRPGLSVRHL